MSASKYKPEYCARLIKHMKSGYSYETFGAEVGVGRRTLYDWEDRHEEWEEAKQKAMEEAQKFFEQRLMIKIAGKKIEGVDPKLVDTACLIFALKTRFHKTYSEKKEHEHSGGIKVIIDGQDTKL